MEGKRKKYVIYGFVFIVLGMGGFIAPFLYESFLPEENILPVQEAIAVQPPTFEEQFIAQDEDLSITPVPTIAPSAAPEATKAPTPTPIRDRLVIAKGNINMPVFLGDTEKTLNKGGWLFPSTSRPEIGGNSVIFGHRYMYRPPKSNTFWNLDKVAIGDEMVLYWKGKEYTYKVFETKVIEPTDLSVIQPTSDSRLTVITCTPLFSTKQRLVVTGALISTK